MELSKNQICSVIITYNPGEAFFELVRIIRNQVGKIVVVDNNSIRQIRDKLVETAGLLHFHLITNTKNHGIAKALNIGVSFARKEGYQWVLTFDQDTKPFENMVDILMKIHNSYPDKSRIGAIGSNAVKANAEKYYNVPPGKEYVDKDYLITSGCLLSSEAFFETGGFREDFFIDNVDLEYSLRLKKHGRVSLIAADCGMIHEAGYPFEKKIAGLKIASSGHSPWRRYYMARNHVILSKEYIRSNPFFILKMNYFFFISLIKIILVEKDKKHKLLESIKGMKDGIIFTRPKSTIKMSRQ
ncbi:MAG: glycosyltransferase family 2 protein [Mangrovibacterium sp.]